MYFLIFWSLLGYLAWKIAVYLITQVDGKPISRGEAFQFMPLSIVGGPISLIYVSFVFFDQYADEIEWFKEDFYHAKNKEEKK